MKISMNVGKIFLVVTFFTLSACGVNSGKGIEQYIGLYEIVSADCVVTDSSLNPCENTFFLEILKGQFIGVENSDLAYVFWSGYPEIDPNLQYTSHLIADYSTKMISDKRFWLNKDKTNQEYLIFRDGILVGYYADYLDREGKVKKIEYTLKSVRRGDKPSYRLNYPGNT
ncbi:hypothetical protein ACPUEK_14720 [Marinomonas gallaica]|uniref:hypothetical protein n=1 Tax=Marinomonas gallaica TaxID=1806667 RepID=UPI003CE52902